MKENTAECSKNSVAQKGGRRGRTHFTALRRLQSGTGFVFSESPSEGRVFVKTQRSGAHHTRDGTGTLAWEVDSQGLPPRSRRRAGPRL